MKLYRLAFALGVISAVILTAGCSSENQPSTPAQPAAAAQPEKKLPVLYTGSHLGNHGPGRKSDHLARVLCLAQPAVHQDLRLLGRPATGCAAVRSFTRGG
jgi:hypothetical protein